MHTSEAINQPAPPQFTRFEELPRLEAEKKKLRGEIEGKFRQLYSRGNEVQLFVQLKGHEIDQSLDLGNYSTEIVSSRGPQLALNDDGEFGARKQIFETKNDYSFNRYFRDRIISLYEGGTVGLKDIQSATYEKEVRAFYGQLMKFLSEVREEILIRPDLLTDRVKEELEKFVFDQDNLLETEIPLITQYELETQQEKLNVNDTPTKLSEKVRAILRIGESEKRIKREILFMATNFFRILELVRAMQNFLNKAESLNKVGLASGSTGLAEAMSTM